MPSKTRQHHDSDRNEPEDETSGEDCDDFGPAEADHAAAGNDRTASGATPTTTTSRNDVIGITEDQLARLIITNVIRGLPTPPTHAGRQTETPTPPLRRNYPQRRECAAVSDEHALRGLPMLLTGDAAIWWQGVRTTIFAEEQTDERSDSFISRVRANLSRLPYKLHEQVQVDIVYGLLNHKIRKRVPYGSVKSIDWLLEQARFVEDTLVSNDDHLFS
ncbi:hypothetical protein ABMA28_010667 [Loxostege sticticalis]|uniref:Uncharacterized protein n=1 Tax=Loxostege sticticalis TaxID=481309 RepID=A0ABD0S934_LOXSC